MSTIEEDNPGIITLLICWAENDRITRISNYFSRHTNTHVWAQFTDHTRKFIRLIIYVYFILPVIKNKAIIRIAIARI